MVDTSFMDDVIFPEEISLGSVGGPDWVAEIVTLANGAEERNTRWSAPLRSYDARYGVKTADQVHQIIEHYVVAMGRMRGFRFKDWTDFQSCPPQQAPAFDDQPLGVGDGATKTFQLRKTYAVLGHSFVREIVKPYGTVLIGVDGAAVTTGFTVDMATGVVTFDAAPADGKAVTWGGSFHVPVRFDCKLDQISMRGGGIEDVPSILLKELRL